MAALCHPPYSLPWLCESPWAYASTQIPGATARQDQQEERRGFRRRLERTGIDGGLERTQGIMRTWGGREGLCGLDRTQWCGDDPTGVGGEDLGVAGLGYCRGGEVTFGNRGWNAEAQARWDTV